MTLVCAQHGLAQLGPAAAPPPVASTRPHSSHTLGLQRCLVECRWLCMPPACEKEREQSWQRQSGAGSTCGGEGVERGEGGRGVGQRDSRQADRK